MGVMPVATTAIDIAAERNELRAQIAELQAEADGMALAGIRLREHYDHLRESGASDDKEPS